MNKKIIIAIVLMLSTVGYLISASFVNNKISYLSIQDLKATKDNFVGKEIKITGKVFGDNLEEKLTKEGKVYKFTIKDKMVKKNPPMISVIYTGILPDSFQKNADVVCTGELNSNGDFVAHSIIAKCPSKYEAQGDDHPDAIKIKDKESKDSKTSTSTITQEDKTKKTESVK